MVKPGNSEAAPASAAEDLLVAYRAGETIYDEGSRDERMFIIEEGTVEIYRRLGAVSRCLAQLERGDFFGQRSLLEDRSRSSAARAATDCRVLPIDASNLDAMLRRYPEIAIRMLRSLSRRLSAYEEAEQRAAVIAAGAAESSAQEAPAAEPADRKVVARLVHASQAEYPVLGEGVTQIGRTDPVTRIAPDVDLDAIDSRQTLSRRHARITATDGRFLLYEHIGTANGTFVGSTRLKAGEEHEIKDGDRLRFGLVELVFRVGPGD